MGLLDDAIREHLELRLRNGADAADIARQEQEALGPVRREPEPEPEPADTVADPEHFDAPTELQPLPEEIEAGEPELEPIEEEDDPEPEPYAPAAPASNGLEETQEWGFDEEELPEEEPEAEEHEDVLEQTPEFLSETPEHDRLWFEQKPPRDFDFDG